MPANTGDFHFGNTDCPIPSDLESIAPTVVVKIAPFRGRNQSCA